MKKYLIILSGVLVLSLGFAGILPALAKKDQNNNRIGQKLGPKGSPTATQLAASILIPSMLPFLDSANKTGIDGQFEVYTNSLQGFPTNDSSWALISTGRASDIDGEATTFYSYDTGGPTSPPYSHRGYPSYDIATLSLVLSVPTGATTLSFNWKFGTEENPTYIGSHVDWARAVVTTSVGSTNILLLPDNKPVDVDNAVPFSNAVTGSSGVPGPPYPSPNDVVYNAVTEMYTSTFTIAPFVGETITIDFQVGDERDRILDSALFIDNLNIAVERIRPDKAVTLAEEIIGAPYLGDGETWGGKGEDCSTWPQKRFVSANEITTTSYSYWHNAYLWDNKIGKCLTGGKGVDCSGVVFWSYNLAYFGEETFTSKEYEARPLHYVKAARQYKDNTDKILKDNLELGDLLFFDKNNNGYMDHVAMYIGGTGTYNAIHASYFTQTITYATYNTDTEKLITTKPGDVQSLKVAKYGRVVEPRIELRFASLSPVDLIIVDPEGSIITSGTWEGPMEYQVYDINGDGELDDIVVTGERKIGDYSITVVPEPDALPTDTYSVEVEVLIDGEIETTVLAEDVPISEIPEEPYVFESLPEITASVKIEPETLNLTSEGVFTAFVQLPEEYDVKDIDVETIESDGAEVIKSNIRGNDTLVVKFDRQDLVDISVGNEVEITVTGELIDGTRFKGSNIIRIINKNKKK